MTDGIKKWKRHALSTQNDLALKQNEINWSSTLCCIASTRFAFPMDGETMSIGIVASQLLAAKATNNANIVLARIHKRRGTLQ